MSYTPPAPRPDPLRPIRLVRMDRQTVDCTPGIWRSIRASRMGAGGVRGYAFSFPSGAPSGQAGWGRPYINFRPVSRSKASRYFARVLVTTSAGSGGGGLELRLHAGHSGFGCAFTRGYDPSPAARAGVARIAP